VVAALIAAVFQFQDVLHPVLVPSSPRVVARGMAFTPAGG
jgi:hypothetical protein